MKTVAFIPSNIFLLNDALFDANLARDNVLKPFSDLKRHLEKNGFYVATADILIKESKIPEYVVVMKLDFSLGYLLKLIKLNSRIKIIYLQTEEESMSCFSNKNFLTSGKLFDVILTWRTDLSSNKIIHQFYPNPTRTLDRSNLNLKRSVFLSLIASNKNGGLDTLYKYRFNTFKVLNQHIPNCQLAGFGWDNKDLESQGINYIGELDNKYTYLSNCIFNLVIENSIECGGISEKIIDSLTAGCIPIYKGSPNVHDYIPKECFIDLRNFSTLEELSLFLLRISEEEICNMQQEIEKFLESSNYHLFTEKVFIKNVNRAIRKASAINKIRKPFRYKMEILRIKFKNRKLTRSKNFWANLITSPWFILKKSNRK